MRRAALAACAMLWIAPTRAGAQAGPEPRQQPPERTQPEHGQPEHGQPEHGQPEHGQPEHGQPEHGQPEHAQPEHAQREHGQPERSDEPALEAGNEAPATPREPDWDDADVARSDVAPPVFRASARVPSESLDVAGRASERIERAQMDERLARSAPDALRYVPGVSVQQTTHGQASPYVRGLTGQQVLVVFDGVRMNNGVYRQGPNQYFFTVDAMTLDRIEVVRGSASVRWGSDAIGGAILAYPFEPRLDPTLDGLRAAARAVGRFASQDLDLEGRGEIQAWFGRDAAVIAGVGYRAAQQLQAAGPLRNPGDGMFTLVPAFEPDGRTQRGTGFRYLTFDARGLARAGPRLRVVAAVHGFRQYDTPRADQCPPPGGSFRDCLRFVEQFRTIALLALRGDAGPELRDVDVALSYQRQHELRSHVESLAFQRYGGLDDVDTLGIAARASSRRLPLERDIGLRVRAGGDFYLDHVSSVAWAEFTDVGIIVPLSRGQYSNDARYGQGGLFGELELDLFGWLRARGGARLAYAGARAPAEPVSRTSAVQRDFGSVVGRAGLEARPLPELSLHLNLEQGFRAPNLDDLTSRQIAGPGFQFENPTLRPEQATTFEIGARVRSPLVRLDAWAYAIAIDGAIARAPRGLADCPPSTPACGGAWFRYQLVNLHDLAWVLGAELAVAVDTDLGLGGSATLAAAWGEGPNPAPRPDDAATPWPERVPLSRVPPVNGTLELRYAHRPSGLVVGGALRWALPQDRLAPSDRGDARIPVGGTPGYAIVDLRAGWRFERHVQIHVALENVFDQPYRVHGSGINGPGRGVAVQVGGAL